MSDLAVLRQYLAIRDAYPTTALKYTRVLALSGMTLEAAYLFQNSIANQELSDHPINMYFYSDAKLGHSIDDTVALQLFQLSAFTRPEKIVYGNGLMTQNGLNTILQWMVDYRFNSYFNDLKSIQITGHQLSLAGNSNGVDDNQIKSSIIQNLNTICNDKIYFPLLESFNFNNNGYAQSNDAFASQLEQACGEETHVTITAENESVDYVPLCSTTSSNTLAYYNMQNITDVEQCRHSWNWEVSTPNNVYSANGPFSNENTPDCDHPVVLPTEGVIPTPAPIPLPIPPTTGTPGMFKIC